MLDMGALLALIPTKDLVYGALIVMLIAAGIYERHHLIAEGQQHELAALKLSSDRLEKQTAAQTANLQAKATMAEQAYDKEQLLIANQPIDSVRLCVNPHSRIIVSPAGSAQPGNAGASAAPGSVQQVPAGDSSVAGPDIGGMLDALAKSADQVSATLREFQSR
jgi:hypothetical protein